MDRKVADPSSAGYKDVPNPTPSEKQSRSAAPTDSAVSVELKEPRKKFNRIAADSASSFTATIEFPGGAEEPPVTLVATSASPDLAGPNSTTVTVPVPDGTTDGDLLLAWVFHREGSISTPTGWTLERTDATPGGIGVVQTLAFYTREASSEPTDYTWTGAASSRKAGVMAALRSGAIESVSGIAYNVNSEHNGPLINKASAGSSLFLTCTSCAITGTSWTMTDATLLEGVGDSRIQLAFQELSNPGEIFQQVLHSASQHESLAQSVICS